MADPVVQAATQNQIRAEKLLEKLWRDGSLGPQIRAMAKAEFPDVQLPEDAIAPVLTAFETRNAALEAQIKDLAEWRTARETEEAERKTFTSMESKVNSAVNEYSLTDEGKAKMLDRMKETGNYTDPDAAAAWVASKTPPVNVPGPTWADQSMNLFGSQTHDDQFKALHTNPQKFMDDQLGEFLRNPDQYVRETFAQ